MGLSYLKSGKARYTGPADNAVQFTLDHQLMNEKTWKDFVEVFRLDCDDADLGWRCEYWGKMMRGAVLTYMYRGDEALYDVLEATVRDMLTTQRKDGRFSTYSDEVQLTGGWDVWGRKYILTGFLHFYRICKDEALKAQILEALKAHADALISKVGPEEEGKRCIFRTSSHWLGVNSCSVLEPMIDLYQTTGQQRYLDFARFIIQTGGCEGGNLPQLAREGKIMPYLYPEVKAYETMSFFEGLLAYYEVAGDPEDLRAVTNFMEAVYETDITAIGCSGCTHELFDHSRIRQILFSEKTIMQETCVTVTWMRMNARLYLMTGERKYIDRLEISGWNALYGSMNTNMLVQYSKIDDKYLAPLPFDSYSPLYNNRRGMGIGGLKYFPFGGYYGCCACIASAGTALVPLCANVSGEQSVVLNLFLPGVFTATLDQKEVRFEVISEYPKKANVQYTVHTEEPLTFQVKLRIPEYMQEVMVSVNQEELAVETVEGYLEIAREWADGDVIRLSAEMPIRMEEVQCDGESRTAFMMGPLTLARDAAKEEENVDLAETVVLPQGPLQWTYAPEEKNELVRIQIRRADSMEDLLLTDYQSCGKGWLSKTNRMTVWHNISKAE